MEQQMKAAKQMIEMQKAGFDGVMNSTLMFLNQSDVMLNSVLGLATWMPEEMKNAFIQQTETKKQGFEFFKKSIDDGYDNLMKLLEEGKFPKFGQ